MTDAIETGTVLEERERYRIILSSDDLVLVWREEAGLDLDEFRAGVAEFARRCEEHRPARAVIDASRLDPEGTAVGWVSGRRTPSGEEEYLSWWRREIVPLYHRAGISSLAVAIGDPNAPGELADPPPGVSFRIGYFRDLASAKEWRAG